MPELAETREQLLQQLHAIRQRLDRLDSTEEGLPQAAEVSAISDRNLAKHIARSPLAMIEWDQNFVFQRWSTRAEQVFGWNADEVLGKSWNQMRFIHDDDVERVEVANNELIKGNVDFNTSLNRNYRKDGSVIYCEWFNTVIRDDQGRMTSWLSLTHDVTERELAKQQSRQARNAMRLVVEGTSRVTGADFFASLVRHLAEALELRNVMLVRTDSAESVRTLALWSNGELIRNINYDLEGTPCERVIKNAASFFANDIQRQFPNATALATMDANSYLGTPLVDSTGEVLGALAAIDSDEIDNRPGVREVLELFANRAAAEIERANAEDALDESRGRQTLALDVGAIGTWDYDVQNDLVYADHGLAKLLKAEQLLREGEARLRVLTEQVPAILWTTDRELRFTLGTGLALQRLGLHTNQLIGVSLQEYFQSDDPEYLPIAKHLSALRGESCSYEMPWQDGVFQVYVEPLRDYADNIVGTIGVALDITERTDALKELEDTRAILSAAIEASPAGIIIADAPDVRIRKVNSAALGICNAPDEQLTDLPVHLHPQRWQCFYPDGTPYQPQDLPLSRAILKGEVSTNVDVIIQRPNGEQRWVLGNAAPVHNRDGDIIGGVVVFPDVSEQRNAEETLRKLEMQLAHLDRVSTVGEMVGGLAHELNQPLYAIQNFAKACRNLLASQHDVDRDQLQSWLDQITSTAEYAGEVLLRLRNFVTKVPMKRTAVDARRMIETALTLTNYDSRELGVRVKCSVPDKMPEVYADPVQIQQVLVNLLRNAFDATRLQSNGDPEVVISAVSNHEFVEFSVADNGPGLPAEDMRIFEAFQSTKPSGMGLGLTIAKSIIDGHGGTLTANDGARDFGGAVFRFTIPLTRR